MHKQGPEQGYGQRAFAKLYGLKLVCGKPAFCRSAHNSGELTDCVAVGHDMNRARHHGGIIPQESAHGMLPLTRVNVILIGALPARVGEQSLQLLEIFFKTGTTRGLGLR